MAEVNTKPSFDLLLSAGLSLVQPGHAISVENDKISDGRKGPKWDTPSFLVAQPSGLAYGSLSTASGILAGSNNLPEYPMSKRQRLQQPENPEQPATQRADKRQKTARRKPSVNFICNDPKCGKMFRGRSELTAHLRVHSGEKPLQCKFAGCGKRFAHSSNLRAHERSHERIKPYKCHYPNCTKAFAHTTTLKEHIWKHEGKAPYVCNFGDCKRRFIQVSNFNRHQKLHLQKLQTNTVPAQKNINAQTKTNSKTSNHPEPQKLAASV